MEQQGCRGAASQAARDAASGVLLLRLLVGHHQPGDAQVAQLIPQPPRLLHHHKRPSWTQQRSGGVDHASARLAAECCAVCRATALCAALPSAMAPPKHQQTVAAQPVASFHGAQLMRITTC